MSAQPAKTSNSAKIVLGIVALLIIGFICGKKKDPAPTASTNQTTQSSTSPTTSNTNPSATDEPTFNWDIRETEDKMGSKSKLASVTAPELLEFEFPYNGGSTAKFTIRKQKGSLDSYLQVSKGQFNSTFEGGSVRIKFDEKPPKKYSFVGPSDHSSDIIFIEGTSDLISKLKSAKKMIIEAEFFSQGSRQIEFNVDGFTW